MGYMIFNKKKLVLNKQKLDEIVEKKGLNYVSLHDKVDKEYGLNLSYKGFIATVNNKYTWKLIYAYAIADVLNVTIYDLFDVVEVDEEEYMKEKEKWNEKYGKKKKADVL